MRHKLLVKDYEGKIIAIKVCAGSLYKTHFYNFQTPLVNVVAHVMYQV